MAAGHQSASGGSEIGGPGGIITGRSDLRGRMPVIFVALVMFTTGAAGLVIEYVLSTVASYILGSSIETWSMTIATMMLAMGLASVLQRHVPDRHLVEAFVAAECGLAVLGGFGPLILQATWVFAHQWAACPSLSTTAVHYTLAAMVGLLIGAEIPLVMRINERWNPELRANLSTVMSADYVGAFAGALVWTFCLLKIMPVAEIAFVVAIFNYMVAMLATFVFVAWGLVRNPVPVLLAQVAVLAILGYGALEARSIQDALERRIYADPIVHSEQSRYQKIVLTHSDAGETRLILNGTLQFASSDEERYHELLVHPAMATAASRERVLILGGGDGLALRRVLDWPDAREVTLVDLDAAMLRLARDNPLLSALNERVFEGVRVEPRGALGDLRVVDRPDGRRVTVVVADAMGYLRTARPSSWDVIIVDLPDPTAVDLAKLYSREFYGLTRRSLRDGGVIAVQSTSPRLAQEAFVMILRTLSAAGLEVIPYKAIVPSFEGEWGFALAWADDRSEGSMRARFLEAASAPRATYLDPETARAALEFPPWMVRSVTAEVNTLMRPLIVSRLRTPPHPDQFEN